MGTIAYGEITILDLLDIATYIYYADDDKGKNPSISPIGKKYIGIYSGSALPEGQPAPNSPAYNNIFKKILWNKYVGDKGDQGTQGEPGKDGAKGDKGDPGLSYGLIINNKEIIKNIRNVNEQGKFKEQVTFSPSIITAEAYKITNNKKEKYSLTKDNVTLKVIKTVLSNEDQSIDRLSNEFIFEIDNFFLTLEDGTLKINFNKLNDDRFLNTDIDPNVKVTPSAPEVSSLSKELADAIKNSEVALKISLKINGSEIFSDFVNIRYITTSEMAKLSVKASGLYASMANAGLVFNESGLTVTNAAFKMQTTKEDGAKETVFFVDETGTLNMHGKVIATGGEFSGTIIAKSGTFNGEIKAKSGSIDGIVTIGEKTQGSIFLNPKGDTPGIYSSNYNQKERTGFFLSQNDGKLYANELNAGGGEISGTLDVLGSLKVGNELGKCIIGLEGANDNYISVYGANNEVALALKQNGSLIVSENGKICNNVTLTDSNYWSIDSDQAIFNNIKIRGILESTTFKKEEISTIGGTLLVRPSSIIRKALKLGVAGQYKINVDEECGIIGDYCKIAGMTYTFKIIKVNNNEITLQGPIDIEINSVIGKLLINYGQNGSIGIAINANDSLSSSLNNGGINVFETVIPATGVIEQKTRIYLGPTGGNDFNNEWLSSDKNFGLYCENVSLSGALVSQNNFNNNKITAGINTNSNIDMPAYDSNNKAFFPQKETGKIILWAGAGIKQNDQDSASGIASAPFKVDTYGNLYAGSGFFNGTIISNATIQAAEIKTAKLVGCKEDGDYALTIKSPKAISFEGNGKQLLELTDSIFKVKIPASFEGVFAKQIAIGQGDTRIEISQSELFKTSAITSTKKLGSIKFLDSSIDIDFNDEQLLECRNDVLNFYKQTALKENVFIDKDFEMGKKMSYKKVAKNNQVYGYDLYVI